MPGPITSSYRLQLHAGFNFDDASRVASYLQALGISHVYCSPYLQATKGSQHGYDVVDHQRVNAELGGEEGHLRFCAALRALGMGQVLDIVPNHMATGNENKYWWEKPAYRRRSDWRKDAGTESAQAISSCTLSKRAGVSDASI